MNQLGGQIYFRRLQEEGFEDDRHVHALLELIGEPLERYQEGLSEGLVPRNNRWDTDRKMILKEVLWQRICASLGTELFFSGQALPIHSPISRSLVEMTKLSPFRGCAGYLLSLFYPDQRLKDEKISIYRVRHPSIGFIERMLLDFFRPIESDEPLQVGDIILYFGGLACDLPVTGAAHYGRVVVVSGAAVWVESKWGFFEHPCLHPLEEVDTFQYGTSYAAARLKETSETPSTDHPTFEKAGFQMTEPFEWPIPKIRALVERLAKPLMECAAPEEFHERF